jgi:hypothetical protein
MCGALATRPPSGPNRAHEKSSLSLMFTEMLVRCQATTGGGAGMCSIEKRPSSVDGYSVGATGRGGGVAA